MPVKSNYLFLLIFSHSGNTCLRRKQNIQTKKKKNKYFVIIWLPIVILLTNLCNFKNYLNTIIIWAKINKFPRTYKNIWEPLKKYIYMLILKA